MDRRLTAIVAADPAGFSRPMAAQAEMIDAAEAGGRIVRTLCDGLPVEPPSPVAAPAGPSAGAAPADDEGAEPGATNAIRIGARASRGLRRRAACAAAPSRLRRAGAR